MRTHFKKRVRKRRDSSGVYLVEILVALSVGALITFSLLSMLGTSMRHATATQNDLVAMEINRQLEDYFRGLSRTVLFDPSNLGEKEFTVNRLSQGLTLLSSIRKEPLQIDFENKNWSDLSKIGAFPGRVKYEISPGPDPTNSVLITIKTMWVDSTRYGANSSSDLGAGKLSQFKFVIFKFGSKAYE